jgi:hypothetical protein
VSLVLRLAVVKAGWCWWCLVLVGGGEGRLLLLLVVRLVVVKAGSCWWLWSVVVGSGEDRLLLWWSFEEGIVRSCLAAGRTDTAPSAHYKLKHIYDVCWPVLYKVSSTLMRAYQIRAGWR